jgi:5'-nucleotidase
VLFDARWPRLAPALAAALTLGVVTVSPAAAAAPSGGGQDNKPLSLRLIGINDFHGNLQPPQGSDGVVFLRDGTKVTAGGGAYMATHIKQLRRQAHDSLLVGVGDLIGASPLESALFHDEPTVDLMNQLDMKASSVGNHEFDKGYKELERIQNGGCSPVDGCRFDHPYRGARFRYLGANVTFKDSGKNALPPYWIQRVNGIPDFAAVHPLKRKRPRIAPGPLTCAHSAGFEPATF